MSASVDDIARALTPARKAALAVMARHQVDVWCTTRTSVEEASVAHRTAEWLRDRGLVIAHTPDRRSLTVRGFDIARSLGLTGRAR